MPAFTLLRAFVTLGLLVTTVTMITPVSLAQADEVSPTKAEKIRELIRVTNSDKLIDTLVPLMTDQLRITIKSSLPNAPKEHIDILTETMQEEMRASKYVFFELMIPQYASLLSEQTIDDTIAFYKTPSGRELAEANPHFATIGSKVGQQWGKMIAPKAAQKALKKARELGYEL